MLTTVKYESAPEKIPFSKKFVFSISLAFCSQYQSKTFQVSWEDWETLNSF